MQSAAFGDKPRPLWQEPMDDYGILRQIEEFVGENIQYGKDPILGFPGTGPELIGATVHNLFLHRHSNNIGMHTNKDGCKSEVGFSGTQKAERQVIAMAADLLGASPDEVDGYISSGGTESNIVGCWVGRNTGLNRHETLRPTAILCSRLTHYSIPKAANILGIGSRIKKSSKSGLYLLQTDKNGHILLDELQNRIAKLADAKIRNIIVVGNAGTTMLGSVDDIPAMGAIIAEAKNNVKGLNIHFHVDAAFGGFAAPFLGNLPKIGFENENVDTVTLDVHKMGLAPYGSGIILARRGLFQRIQTVAPYVPGGDCTFSGSRSGTMALTCWAVMRKLGKEGYSRNARALMDLTNRVQGWLREAGFDTFDSDLNIVAVRGIFPEFLRNEFITHIHENCPADLFDSPNSARAIWNIVVMNHTKEELIEDLISKFKK